MENSGKFNLNQVLFAILIVGVLAIPSAFAEEIPIILETNRQNFEFGDPIILQVYVEKIVPNTPLEIEIFKDGTRIPGQIKTQIENNSNDYLIWLLRDQPSGAYEIFVYYGRTFQSQGDGELIEGKLGFNSIEIKYNSKLSSNAKFLKENFMVDEFDIGTLLHMSNIQSYSFPRITFCEIDFCYDSMIAKQFDEGGTGNHVRVEIFEFKDASTAKNFYSKLLEDPLQYDPKETEEIDIKEGFECGTAYYVSYGYNEYAIVCYTDDKLFKIFVKKGSTSFRFDFREQANIFAEAVSEKIDNSKEKISTSNNISDSKSSELHDNEQEDSKYNKKLVFDFVDTSKDPQHYIDRYNNEPKYREWFDTNYPDFTIEEAVGLDIKFEIPQWVKNIFGWYSKGEIGDDELIKSLQFLIKEGIIKV